MKRESHRLEKIASHLLRKLFGQISSAVMGFLTFRRFLYCVCVGTVIFASSISGETIYMYGWMYKTEDRKRKIKKIKNRILKRQLPGDSPALLPTPVIFYWVYDVINLIQMTPTVASLP